MSNSDILEVEHQVAGLKELVLKCEMALRLAENADFRTLFIDGFCKDEAARLVIMSTDPNLKEEIRQSCLAEAQAAGYVKRYLSYIVQAGHTARNGIAQAEEMLDQLRAEEIS